MCHTMMCQFQDHKGDCNIDVAKYQEKHNMSPCIVGRPGALEEKIDLIKKELVYLNASMNGYKFKLKHDYSLTDEEIRNFVLFSKTDCFEKHRETVDFTLLYTILSLQKTIEAYTRCLRHHERATMP